MSTTIEHRTWRYATKNLIPQKKMSDKDFEPLMEAICLSASSYGFQPCHIFIIINKEIREKLKPFSWGQSQITDASHLVVFVNKTNFNSKLMDNYLTNVSDTRNLPIENLKEYGDFMKSKLLD